jgi:hypothetical protein
MHRSKQRLFDHLVSTGLQHRARRHPAFQCFALIVSCSLGATCSGAGFIGAVLLIWIVRAIRPARGHRGHAKRSKRLFAADEARTAKQDGEEDIMTHVLIVMSWLGAVNGAVISTQEFASAERCEAARRRKPPLPTGLER